MTKLIITTRWCVIELSQSTFTGNKMTPWKHIIVWGRRGKKLQYRIVDSKYQFDREWSVLYKKASQKKENDYMEIDKLKLANVYPEFEQDMEGIAMWATLAN